MQYEVSWQIRLGVYFMFIQNITDNLMCKYILSNMLLAYAKSMKLDTPCHISQKSTTVQLYSFKKKTGGRMVETPPPKQKKVQTEC